MFKKLQNKIILVLIGLLAITVGTVCISYALLSGSEYLPVVMLSLAASCLLISSFVIKTIVSHWVTSPLQILQNAMNEISSCGMTSSPLTAADFNKDEVGSLGNSFHLMLCGLRQTTFSRRYLEEILDNITAAFFVTDTNRRILYHNSAALTLLKCSREYLSGKSVDMLFSDPSQNPFLNQDLATDISQTHCNTYKADLRTTEGEIVPTSFCCSYMENDQTGLCNYICTAQNMSDVKKAKELLFRQANYDSLTNLYNRYYLEDRIQEIMQDGQKDGRHAFLLIDLDRFKIVNDICGHNAGDQLLCHIAHMIKKSLRPHDIIARIGSDEFAAFLPSTTIAQATEIAKTLCKLVKEIHFSWDSKIFPVSASIGVVETDEEICDVQQMQDAADRACLIAKGKGGNDISVYTRHNEDLTKRKEETKLVPAISNALENNGFFLVFQPIISFDNKNPLQVFEALIRMRDKDGAAVAPATFLPAAHRYNMMPMIDRWVIEHFFSTFHQRISPYFNQSHTLFNLNISAASLNEGNAEAFFSFIQHRLCKYHIPPEMICFEITETNAISNFVDVSSFISGLKQLGCKFALDDFGSGFSSFSYLKFLPVDYIKIDGQLVKDIVDNPVDCAMVAAINQIAHILKKKTIAEHVETKAVFDLLEKMGIDYGQGFGLARPAGIDQLLEQKKPAGLPDIRQIGSGQRVGQPAGVHQH